jgi:hypothetical protein
MREDYHLEYFIILTAKEFVVIERFFLLDATILTYTIFGIAAMDK